MEFLDQNPEKDIKTTTLSLENREISKKIVPKIPKVTGVLVAISQEFLSQKISLTDRQPIHEILPRD